MKCKMSNQTVTPRPKELKQGWMVCPMCRRPIGFMEPSAEHERSGVRRLQGHNMRPTGETPAIGDETHPPPIAPRSSRQLSPRRPGSLRRADARSGRSWTADGARAQRQPHR